MNESENNLNSVHNALARPEQRLVSLRILHSLLFLSRHTSAHYESNCGFYLVWVSTLSMMPYSLVFPPRLARHQYCPLCSGNTGEIIKPTWIMNIMHFLFFLSSAHLWIKFDEWIFLQVYWPLVPLKGETDGHIRVGWPVNTNIMHIFSSQPAITTKYPNK